MRFSLKEMDYRVPEKISDLETTLIDWRNRYQLWWWIKVGDWNMNVYVSYQWNKGTVWIEDEHTKLKFLMMDVYDWMKVSPEIVQEYERSFKEKRKD